MEEDFSPDCLVMATADVVVGRKEVGVMIRLSCSELDLDPDAYGLGEGQISGWVLMSGEETTEDLDNNEMTVETLFVENIIEVDPAIAPYLTLPAPLRLERDESAPIFYQIED